MKTIALIEKGKDGTFGVFTPDLNSTIIGEGNTVAEAKADFERSVNEVIEVYKGRDLPEELRDLQFEYKYDVPSVFNQFDCINITRFSKRANINASLLRQYSMGKSYISERQAKKIESAFHDLAHQLMNVTLL